VTSSITNAAVDDLKLTVGKQAYAVIKASKTALATAADCRRYSRSETPDQGDRASRAPG
jgi:hypothetical protein